MFDLIRKRSSPASPPSASVSARVKALKLKSGLVLPDDVVRHICIQAQEPLPTDRNGFRVGRVARTGMGMGKETGTGTRPGTSTGRGYGQDTLVVLMRVSQFNRIAGSILYRDIITDDITRLLHPEPAFPPRPSQGRFSLRLRPRRSQKILTASMASRYQVLQHCRHLTLLAPPLPDLSNTQINTWEERDDDGSTIRRLFWWIRAPKPSNTHTRAEANGPEALRKLHNALWDIYVGGGLAVHLPNLQTLALCPYAGPTPPEHIEERRLEMAMALDERGRTLLKTFYRLLCTSSAKVRCSSANEPYPFPAWENRLLDHMITERDSRLVDVFVSELVYYVHVDETSTTVPVSYTTKVVYLYQPSASRFGNGKGGRGATTACGVGAFLERLILAAAQSRPFNVYVVRAYRQGERPVDVEIMIPGAARAEWAAEDGMDEEGFDQQAAAEELLRDKRAQLKSDLTDGHGRWKITVARDCQYCPACRAPYGEV